MLVVVLVLLLAALVSGVITLRLLRRGRIASTRQFKLIASLPVPLLLWALAGYVFTDALTGTAEECGPDACGMAALAAMWVAVLALGPLVLGLVISHLVIRRYQACAAE